MALPKQVQKQSEEVQELYKELNTETTETQADTAKVSEEQVVEPIEQQPSDSVEEQAPKSEASEQSKSDTQVKENWEQKYKSLQGMYNADVPRLNTQNRDLTARVEQLEKLLSEVPPKVETSEPEPVASLITEDDLAAYGDSIDVMRKAAREELTKANSKVAQLEAQIAQLQGVLPQVQQVQAQQKKSSEQIFWDTISSKVPHWNDINTNPDFQSWLLEIDPLTGVSRETYLEDAQRSLDAHRVVNFFTTWEQATGKPSTAQPTRKAQDSSLQKQVSPGRSRSNGASPSGEPPTYSPKDITKFFSDVRQGKYKGRDDERGRIERDIFAAQAEGRITAN